MYETILLLILCLGIITAIRLTKKHLETSRKYSQYTNIMPNIKYSEPENLHHRK